MTKPSGTAVDPAAFELRTHIKASRLDASKLRAWERQFLANYLRTAATGSGRTTSENLDRQQLLTDQGD